MTHCINQWERILEECKASHKMEKSYVDNLLRAGRSVPGQSLTNDPEQRYEFEKAPEITNLREGIEFVFLKLIEEETYPQILELVGAGVPIMEITQNILFQAFDRGIVNPDLMMLLAEPTAYMIMALAERADIDYTIYKGEEEEEAAENAANGYSEQEARLKEYKKTNQIPQGALPTEIVEQIATMETPQEESLMARPEPSLLQG